jgi:putative tricarboxylic transport membrane protein
MAGAGLVGWVLRKLEFETAPIVLGLVLSPMIELAFRQALALSGGSYAIFFERPLAAMLLLVAGILLALALKPK